MGLIDKYLLGKKSIAEEVLASSDAVGAGELLTAGQPEVPPAGAVPPGQVPPPPPAVPDQMDQVGQPAGPQAVSVNPVAPTPAAPVAPAAQEPGPDSSPSSEADVLDSPLRDLFTENTTIDPQLESLLTKVEEVDAGDLSSELREFARSIGLDGTGEKKES